MLLLLLLIGCVRTDGASDKQVDEDTSGDADGDGVGATEDCDDADAAVFPGAIESCDGLDQDCDGLVDEDATDAATWYADTDGDGFGDPAVSAPACDPPDDFGADATDCDDADADVAPDGTEVCNGADDDCDGSVDEDAVDADTWYVDVDGDGFGDPDAGVSGCEAGDLVAFAGDCDDTDAAVSPAGIEACNGIDEDCDGEVDEDPIDAEAWYADADGDGFGDVSVVELACWAPAGFGADETDCDDTDATVFPDGVEICNATDDDCDGVVDDDAIDAGTWYADADGDGFGDASATALACDAPSAYIVDATDCDDGDAAIHPGVSDTCDAIDEDCDGTTDEDGGPGTLLAGWPSAASAARSSLGHPLVVDLDGDALLDMVGCQDQVMWALNPGGPWIEEGEWVATWEWDTLSPNSCEDTDIVDVDDDGDPDLVAPMNDDTLAWFENDGGTLTFGGTLGTGVGGYVAVGDFDVDGKTDIAVSPYVFWNDGGSFTQAAWPCTSSNNRVSAAPLRAGGGATLLCWEHEEAYVADTARVWSAVPLDATCSAPSVSQGPGRTADFDGDGNLDALAARESVHQCAGDGAGGLALADTLVSTAFTTWVSNIADANADGWSDFAVNDEEGELGDIHLFEGGVSGPTLLQSLFVPHELHQGGGALYEDLDGDAEADLFAWDEHDGDFYWYPSDGQGGFYSPWAGNTTASGSSLVATAADLDGDGSPEVVSASEDTAWVFWNAGDRSLVEGDDVPLVAVSGYYRMWPGGLDLDVDGDEEVVVLPYFGGDWYVLDWDAAAGELIQSAAYAGPSLTWSYTFQHAADVDGDGDPELLVENAAHEGGTSIYADDERIWIGGVDEAGFPSTWTDLIDTVGTDTVLAVNMDADLDGDGLVDLALVDADGVRIWSYDGSALSETVSTDLAWAATATDLDARRWLATADADGDGDIDLHLALRDEAAIQVLLNDGSGVFSLGDRLVAPDALVDAEEAHVSDLTGDGRLEAWNLASSGDGLLSSWRDGASGWESLSLQTPDIEEYATATDVDGDGMPDLVAGEEDRVWVYWGVSEEVTLLCE